MVKYVNVYSIDRAYGGPEEGGWWYDTGDVVHTVRCEGSDEDIVWKRAEQIRRELADEYPYTGRRSSVLGGDDYDIRIEDEPGQDWSNWQPWE